MRVPERSILPPVRELLPVLHPLGLTDHHDPGPGRVLVDRRPDVGLVRLPSGQPDTLIRVGSDPGDDRSMTSSTSRRSGPQTQYRRSVSPRSWEFRNWR